jgi:hypothetical protein
MLITPWTATGRKVAPSTASPAWASPAPPPRTATSQPAAASAEATDASAALPASSHPNGRSGRRTISRAPVTAYGIA